MGIKNYFEKHVQEIVSSVINTEKNCPECVYSKNYLYFGSLYGAYSVYMPQFSVIKTV